MYPFVSGHIIVCRVTVLIFKKNVKSECQGLIECTVFITFQLYCLIYLYIVMSHLDKLTKKIEEHNEGTEVKKHGKTDILICASQVSGHFTCSCI